MRKRDGIYNLLFGFGAQLTTMALGLFIPRLFMVEFGSASNGLISSLNQIFAYASLLEAGVGVSALQALYKPIAQDDKQGISGIVAATDHYFRRTGIAYGVLVFLLALCYPLLVDSEISYWTCFWVIISMGVFGVIRYFFQGKYVILLQAQGKTYITSNISTIGTILANACRIGIMLTGGGLILVQSAYCLCNFLPMLYVAYYIRKHCNWLDLSIKPDLKALDQKYSVLLHSVSGLIFYSTSSIVLSIFCNLKVVSVYVVYALVFTMLGSIIGTVSTSITFALGQIFQVDRERYAKLQDTWENYFLAFVFSLLTTAYLLILPFIQLYTKGVDDIDYIVPALPVLFFAVNALDYGRKTSSQIINFAGHFRQTLWRSLLESSINITVSIICVIYFGIYGVLLGALTALIYRSNDMILYANRKIMHRSPWPTYRRWILNLGTTLLFIYIVRLLPIHIDDYLSFFIWGGGISIASMSFFLLFASFFDRQAFLVAEDQLKPLLKKLHFIC